MTIVIPSSSAEIVADPQRLLDEMRQGRIINLTDLGYVIAPTTEIVGLADELAEEELLEEMVSYRKNVTGVDNTIFISPKGNTRQAPRIKLAIDPPDSADPRATPRRLQLPTALSWQAMCLRSCSSKRSGS